MMDWDGFRVFLSVARAGRLSLAAKRLRVDATTVSRRLTAFERQLGGPLFYRTLESYQLTELGRAALQKAEVMEQAATAVRAQRSESSSAPAGRVRVALLDEFASHWLVPQLGAFRARYPDIEPQVIAGVPPLDMARGEADLAIRTPRPKQKGLAAVRLAATQTALFASKRLIGKRQLSVKDVASACAFPFLIYSPEHHALQSATWFRPVLAQAKLALVTNSSHALLAGIRAGLGLGVLPTFMAHLHDDLVCVSEPLYRDEHWLVLHPEFRRDPKVRALAEFLKRVAVGPAGLGEARA